MQKLATSKRKLLLEAKKSKTKASYSLVVPLEVTGNPDKEECVKELHLPRAHSNTRAYRKTGRIQLQTNVVPHRAPRLPGVTQEYTERSGREDTHQQISPREDDLCQ